MTDEIVMGREYSADDLRGIWDFVQHDFERFLECIVWLETLSHKARREQLESGKSLRRPL